MTSCTYYISMYSPWLCWPTADCIFQLTKDLKFTANLFSKTHSAMVKTVNAKPQTLTQKPVNIPTWTRGQIPHPHALSSVTQQAVTEERATGESKVTFYCCSVVLLQIATEIHFHVYQGMCLLQFLILWLSTSYDNTTERVILSTNSTCCTLLYSLHLLIFL